MKKYMLDEDALIKGLQAGGIQRRVFERKLYEHFFYLIRHGARKYGITEDISASAYSDTIISVIENIVARSFAGKSSLKSYTYQIHMNKCIDAVRRNTANKARINNEANKIDSLVINLPDQVRSIVQQMMDNSDQTLLLQKVKELGEKCQQLLLLFEDGYSDKEIAQQMQYNSAEVVKTSRLRCLEKLREKVFNNKSNG